MSSVITCLNLQPTKNRSFDLRKVFLELDKCSPGHQLAAGGCGGLVLGYFTAKVGKWAAVTAGGGLIALQYLNYKGYVKVDWSLINQKVKDAYERFQESLTEESQGSTTVNNIATFMNKHSYIAGGFLAGYLIGFGCA